MRCSVDRIIPAITASVILTLSAYNGHAAVGGESGAYLRAPVGATALAMGGAGSASPQYLMAWWNPAGIAALRTTQISAGAGIKSMGRTEAYGSFDFRIPPRMGMGVALLYRGDPFINDLHDEQNGELVDLGKGAFTSITLKLALSFYVNRNLDLGASINTYYQSLPTGLTSDNKLTNSSVTGIGGFDLAVRYAVSGDWHMGVVARNLGAGMQWQLQSEYDGLNVTIDDKPLPQFVLSSIMTRKLLGFPLRWACDLEGDLVDGDFVKLPQPQAVLFTGVEWRRWESFYLRAGFGDLAIDRSLTRDTRAYFSTLGYRITLGFSADLKKVRNGVRLNYAVSTDKVWAGIDNVLDLHYEF